MTTTAQSIGLLRCSGCGALYPLEDLPQSPVAVSTCDRCGSKLLLRRQRSLQRTWAFLLTGLLAYIPANTLPIMTTNSLTYRESDTIYTGIKALFESGRYFVAIIVFVASICIPVIKFAVIGPLLRNSLVGGQ